MAQAGDGKKRSDKRRAHSRVSKRLTLKEAVDFEKQALAAGFRNSQEYLTAFIRGETAAPTRKDMGSLIGHLGKVGGNLNQLARKLNEGRSPLVAEEVDGVLNVINKTLAAVRVVGSEIRDALR